MMIRINLGKKKKGNSLGAGCNAVMRGKGLRNRGEKEKAGKRRRVLGRGGAAEARPIRSEIKKDRTGETLIRP